MELGMGAKKPRGQGGCPGCSKASPSGTVPLRWQAPPPDVGAVLPDVGHRGEPCFLDLSLQLLQFSLGFPLVLEVLVDLSSQAEHFLLKTPVTAPSCWGRRAERHVLALHRCQTFLQSHFDELKENQELKKSGH